MPGRSLILLSIFLFLGIGVSHGDIGQKQKETAALTATREWLKLVDTGKYPESWNESAGIFRAAITRDKWVQVMQSGREPFGALVSRKLTGSKYATELPGAPQGEYVVIQFETMFQNRKGIIVETVTPMLDKDKKWRVSGYFMK